MTSGVHVPDGGSMKIDSIEFRPHAIQRLKEREISIETIVEILKSPDTIFWDVEENHYVAIKYLEPGKGYMIAFDVEGSKLIVVTAYYSSKLGKTVERRKGGRWIEVQLRFEV